MPPTGLYELENDDYRIKQNAAKFTDLNKRLKWLKRQQEKAKQNEPTAASGENADGSKAEKIASFVNAANDQNAKRKAVLMKFGDEDDDSDDPKKYLYPDVKETKAEIIKKHIKATRDKIKMRDFVEKPALEITDSDERIYFFIDAADSRHGNELEFYSVDNWRNEVDKMTKRMTVDKSGQSSEEKIFKDSNRIRCNMSQAELITMFYNMVEEGFINPKDKTKVRKMIIEYFADSTGQPYKAGYVEKLFKPSNVDCRAVNHVNFSEIEVK